MADRKPEGWLFTPCWSGAHSKCRGVITLEPSFANDYCTCACHVYEDVDEQEVEAMAATMEKKA